MTETASLLSLFTGSFLAATLLPGGSEAVLFLVLKSHPESFWPALAVATLGNTLGGMVSFAMGWLLPQFQRGGAGGTASDPLTRTDRVADEAARDRTQQLRQVEKLRRYGTPALLFAWAPLVGDALCLAAGWLRLNPWQAALFMALGKGARYLVIAWAV
ncbi:MAG: DedA family protein [Gallionella sp.]|nr:DedA family protein [Gallionella sp.]OIO12486.1 MAG: hypothetical protein AUJ80_00690 [Gallionellaceae bacterium CG1_02_60_325]PIR09566.1 MAG: hypothetical protein COV51_03490 [Gallionellaceae bacterium CG11_big_fil_rev_8_21_14_0_20_60_62]PJC04431.1 MAG: DedA family protein [Gallionellaceae bacterium CG_4_9_14_0_8_um_filter_60_335]NCP80307.1 DedA family protein [Gallionella sp.]